MYLRVRKPVMEVCQDYQATQSAVACRDQMDWKEFFDQKDTPRTPFERDKLGDWNHSESERSQIPETIHIFGKGISIFFEKG
jgi:hypothetical protein